MDLPFKKDWYWLSSGLKRILETGTWPVVDCRALELGTGSVAD